jgi:hypothetical protein
MKKALVYILVVMSLQALGQTQEELSPEERKQLTKITEPVTLYKGFFRTRLSTFTFTSDRNFDQNGKRITYPNISGGGLVLFAMMQYGITDRLEIETNIPYQRANVQSSYFYEIPYQGVQGMEKWNTRYAGISDVGVTLRYQLITDKPGSPAVVLGLTTYLPTAQKNPENMDFSVDGRNFDAPTGKGELGFAPELRIRKIAYPFSFELGAGYVHYLGTEKVISKTNSTPQRVVSGGELLVRPQMNFHLNEWVSLTHYVDYYTAFKDSYTGVDDFGTHNNVMDQYAIRYYPGITFQLKRVRLEQAVLIPLAGKVFSADPQYFFAIDYIF